MKWEIFHAFMPRGLRPLPSAGLACARCKQPVTNTHRLPETGLCGGYSAKLSVKAPCAVRDPRPVLRSTSGSAYQGTSDRIQPPNQRRRLSAIMRRQRKGSPTPTKAEAECFSPASSHRRTNVEQPVARSGFRIRSGYTTVQPKRQVDRGIESWRVECSSASIINLTCIAHMWCGIRG